jgi:cobalt-precorrin 5A hydrolase
MSRLVIGLGFRDATSAASIGEVFAAAVARAGASAAAIAVPDDKAAHPALRAAASVNAMPIETVSSDAMREADAGITTRSQEIQDHRGVGSVCEAAALAAAGKGSRLVVSRVVSADRTATAAAALSEDTS